MKKRKLATLRKYRTFIGLQYHNFMILFIGMYFQLHFGVVYSQQTGITIKKEHMNLSEILLEIKHQSGKSILFSNDIIDRYKDVSINKMNVTLEEAINECLKGKELQFRIVDDVIIIEPKSIEKNTNNNSNELFQTIRGQVIDQNTCYPLVGANIVLLEHEPRKGTITDLNGYFEMKSVPVGRQSIEVSYMGYNNTVIKNLYLLSGKEAVLMVKLEEKVFQEEEVIFRATRKDKPINEMAQVSARSFTVEETERYAGSVGDPSRMASSYAGVLTLGTQINDIVIRGNSTIGMLWRMEGLKIPNPNHFGDLWSTGGTSSMINNNVLSNSDFYTGAFPAEFGDALSGVFDLNLRKGNTVEKEYLAQVGFGGLEFGAEGPFVKGTRASYLANYRYSTMGIFDLLGLDIGIFTVPSYQDFTFKIDVPTQKFGKFSLFGLGGQNSLKSEDIDAEENKIDITRLVSYTGFTGLNHLYFLNENSSISTSIGLSATEQKTLLDTRENDIIDEFYWEKNEESTLEFSLEYKNKINSRNIIKIGFDYISSTMTFIDSVYLTEYDLFIHNKDVNGIVPLIQSYAQLKHRFSDHLSVVGGIHYQYSKLGNDYSVEPRLSLAWDFLRGHSLNLGFGRHSKLQPKFVYHYEILTDTANKVYTKPNENLKMTRSKHLILGYNYLFNSNHRLIIEGYYQYLSNIPVEDGNSYKSLINYGSSFSDYDYKGLVNKGTGYNYGLELTLERFLAKGYYYLFTLSLFESKYEGSDGILRDTRFNANAICNLLGGYEWAVGKNNTIGFDLRAIFAGGERKIPLDYEASAVRREAVYDIPNAYNERFKNYFRLDTKFYFTINKRTSHMIAVDIINVTNRQNHFKAIYDEDINDYEEISTLSILPTFLWRWNF